jgi:KaiC/GvpD/RAD55 family RecA-like ATPase
VGWGKGETLTINRITSGIPGLDNMIGGGFPVPSTLLLAGDPGVGKTTMSLQFLFHGASHGETSIYMTAISEPTWVVQKFLSEFSFYDQDLLDSEKVIFVDLGSHLTKQPYDLLETITRIVESYNPKRLVIDPLTPIKEMFEQNRKTRKFLHDFIAHMKAMDCVTMMTAEFSYGETSGNLEAYMVDGVIMLSYPEEEGVRRKYLEVLKMRGTKHVTGRQVVDITPEGMAVQAGLR